MSKLIDLLKDLGRDADLASEYGKDPDAVIKRYDLDDEEREALLSEDLDKIRKITGLDKLELTNSTIRKFD